MARINIAQTRAPIVTHEGGRAAHINPIQQLRRSVLATLLWEDQFYEDGQSIVDRIAAEAQAIKTDVLVSLAIEARQQHGLRHAPLLLLLELIRRGGSEIAPAFDSVIKRADEMTELVALYWQANPGKGLTRQMRNGLARAFKRFDEYQLAKYDRDAPIKLRDVLRLSHPKVGNDEAKSALFKRVDQRTLAVPDTWETELSKGADKKATFERLIRENRLGYLALLRNLRGMMEAGVDRSLVEYAILARRGADMVWPFRFTAAARACPQLEPVLDQALIEKVSNGPRLSGLTAVLVDVSSSMNARLSAKSDMTRADAAATLASVINGQLRVFSFSDRLVEVPPRVGMAGVDTILRSQHHHGTALFDAVAEVNAKVKYDRIIVITDEQANGPGVFGYRIHGTRNTLPDPLPAARGYMINVASAKNGVGYGRWAHIDGFSEAVIRYITEVENLD
jgi:hypothetical protein